MSAISGISGVPQTNVANAAALQKKGTAAAAPAAASNVRDSDGDFDGTAPGQVDANDFGKGQNIDRMA